MNIDMDTINRVEYLFYDYSLKIFILRNSLFSTPQYPVYAGYILLPEDHPLYGIEDCNDEHLCDLDVHGGITYADGKIIGFDTLHLGDYNPILGSGNRKWPLSLVVKEASSLAEQVAELADKKKGH